MSSMRKIDLLAAACRVLTSAAFLPEKNTSSSARKFVSHLISEEQSSGLVEFTSRIGTWTRSGGKSRQHTHVHWYKHNVSGVRSDHLEYVGHGSPDPRWSVHL